MWLCDDSRRYAARYPKGVGVTVGRVFRNWGFVQRGVSSCSLWRPGLSWPSHEIPVRLNDSGVGIRHNCDLSHSRMSLQEDQYKMHKTTMMARSSFSVSIGSHLLYPPDHALVQSRSHYTVLPIHRSRLRSPHLPVNSTSNPNTATMLRRS